MSNEAIYELLKYGFYLGLYEYAYWYVNVMSEVCDLDIGSTLSACKLFTRSGLGLMAGRLLFIQWMASRVVAK